MALWLGCKPDAGQPSPGASASTDTNSRMPWNRIDTVVHLYFADPSHRFLVAEKKSIADTGDPVSLGSAIIEALISGPSGELCRTIPESTQLMGMYITQDGTAYVDFSDALSNDHPGGAQMELFTIYAIVNSLVLNIDAVDSVKLLIAGRESKTLSGHMDLQFPFKANMLMVR